MNKIHRFSPLIKTPLFNLRQLSSKPTTKKPRNGGGGDDEWNDAWETAWLPDDLSPKHRAPWEADVNFSISNTDNQVGPSSDVDPDTKAFVEDMNDNWDHRRGKKAAAAAQHQGAQLQQKDSIFSSGKNSLYGLERVKRDYRVKKQRVHAGLWMKEIEKMEESKLADSVLGGGGGAVDDIERFLDSASEIFDSTNNDLNNSQTINSSELKNKPDGWETTAKGQDGNIWEMSQREEDILLQEFERRIAFSKFQIASFIKTHIFSRRRPIDGWKYMIEELGPNARKWKGVVFQGCRVSLIHQLNLSKTKRSQLPLVFHQRGDSFFF